MDKSSSNPQRLLCGKRIIFILYSLEIGGAERQALYLARYLQDMCLAKVEIWAFCNPGRLVDICDEYHIKWRLLPIRIGFDHRQIIINSICLGVALLLARPQILLPYLTPANIYCGLSWRFTAAKVCIWNQRNAGHTIHNLEFEKKAAHKVTALVANTELGADFIRNTYKVPQKRVHVIHNGVESVTPKKDKKFLKDIYNIPDGAFVACMVANLHANKDHITLLRAWAQVANQIQGPARLLLAGRFDSSQGILKSLAKDLNIEDSVCFLGPVKEVSELLQIVDVGILTSPSQRGEGMSNAILEYMMAGLPVVSTDILSIRETVGEENFKYLAPLKDADRLAELIIAFAYNKELRQEVGRKNSEWVKKSFPLEKMCDQHRDLIITHLLNAHP